MMPRALTDENGYPLPVGPHPGEIVVSRTGAQYERQKDLALRKLPEKAPQHLRPPLVANIGDHRPEVSILSRIRHAKNVKVLHDNLRRALREVPAKAKTKKRWKRAAELRLGELRLEQIVKVGGTV